MHISSLRKLVPFLVLALLALITTLFYFKFGSSNHAVIIPFLKNAINPDLYPGDYLIPEKKYYLTFLWDLVALIVKRFGISIEAIFFVGYSLSIFFSLLGIYKLAMLLYERIDVAFLAIFIQIFAFIHNPGLGGEYLMDHIFKESMVSVPFLIFAIYFFLKGKLKMAFLLLGLAFLIHPLTSIYVFGFLSFSLLLNFKTLEARRILTALAIFFIITIPLVIRKYLNVPPSADGFFADTAWVELLRIRSAHHIFPFSWSPWVYIKAMLLLLVFMASLRHKPVSDQHHQTIIISVFFIFGLWILGTIFTEFYPVRLAIQLQLFRSYCFLTLFVILYFSNHFMKTMAHNEEIKQKMLVILLMMLLIITPPNFDNKNLLFMGFAAIIWMYTWVKKESIKPYLTVVLITAISTIFFTYSSLKKGSLIRLDPESDWTDIQRWAKSNTKIGDIFIVPPEKEGFRVGSERSIYGDWKDGTQMFFNPDFGLTWINRMENLGYRIERNVNTDELVGIHYNQNLTEMDLISICRDIDLNYKADDYDKLLVVPIETRLKFPELYRNRQYVVHHIRQ